MANDTATSAPAWRRRFPGTLLIVFFGLSLTALAWLDLAHRQSSDRAAEIARIHRENGSLARAFEEHVRRVLQSADRGLLFLQEEYAARGRVTETMVDFVDRAARDPLLSRIALADASGTLFLSAVPHQPGISIAQRDYFRVHAADNAAGLFVGKPLVTRPSGSQTFFLSRRLNRPDGSFAGAVCVELDPAYFSTSFNDTELGQDRTLVLLGRDGIVRARRFQHRSEIGQDLGSSPLFAAIQRSPVGDREEVCSTDGLQRFVSYRALPDFPLIVVVSDLTATALAPYERRVASYRFMALVFTIFVAVFCLVLLRADRHTRLQNASLTTELGEKRRAEKALRDSQDLFSAFLENIPAAVFVQDLHGRILFSNQVYRDLAAHEAIGGNARELIAPRGEGSPDALPVLRGDSVTLDEAVTGEDGRVRIFETRMFVVRRGEAEPLLGCISVDGTGRRHAEEQRFLFERRMQQTQKLESLGILAGGIAHDFNNLLMVILGNTDLALAKLPQDSPVRALVQNVDIAAQRAADLTNQMLAYSGKGRFVIEPVNLSQLVAEMGQLMTTVIAKNVSVRYRLHPVLPLVLADATQIRQVVMNLITNASDAIGQREGTITIGTRPVTVGGNAPLAGLLDHSLPPGDYAAVEVADTGSGMDVATQEKIFDPFFTTKDTGRGLGLASVLGIVQGHTGGIQVVSRPGQGTTVSVLLPAAADDAFAPQPPAEHGSVAPAPETVPPAARPVILVVDDEEAVRSTAKAMLEENGFAAVTAADGVECVDLFRTHHGSLAAVLLDMSMPRMGGEEAFRLLQSIDSTVPVILMSGYDENEAVGRFTGGGLAGFIRKPYRLRTLIEKIRGATAGHEPDAG